MLFLGVFFKDLIFPVWGIPAFAGRLWDELDMYWAELNSLNSMWFTHTCEVKTGKKAEGEEINTTVVGAWKQIPGRKGSKKEVSDPVAAISFEIFCEIRLACDLARARRTVSPKLHKLPSNTFFMALHLALGQEPLHDFSSVAPGCRLPAYHSPSHFPHWNPESPNT